MTAAPASGWPVGIHTHSYTLLEIISDDGDANIRRSHQAIATMGWEAPPG